MLNMNKINERKAMVLDLTKKQGIENQKAQVVLCMDISGSMGGLYRNGYVQEVLERIVPIALQFDDNGELDLYLFSDYCKKHSKNVTLQNLENFISREIYGKYEMNGTEYARPMKMIKEEAVGGGGFFSSAKKKLKYPVYVVFITDGRNDDEYEAEKTIKEISHHGIFFQFVGIGKTSFPFLERLDNLQGRFIDNANFFKVPDLTSMADSDMYEKLLAEFPSWLKLAKEKNIIE